MSQDKSCGFSPKIQASDWLTYLVYQLEACFLVGNNLNSCLDSDLRKLTLVYVLPSNHQLKIKIISQFKKSPVCLRIFFYLSKKSTNQHLSEALYHMTTKYIDTMHAWWTTFIFVIWIKKLHGLQLVTILLTILNCQIINQNLPKVKVCTSRGKIGRLLCGKTKSFILSLSYIRSILQFSRLISYFLFSFF